MIGVTGYRGRLGTELVKLGGVPIKYDVTDINSMSLLRNSFGVNDTIIHCAAVTNVDKCEKELYELAYMVNQCGTKNLCNYFDGNIIYISTDYIFDGSKGNYDEHSIANPISVYGHSKLLGEEQIRYRQHSGDVIVRTTILYGTKGHEDFVTRVINEFSTGHAITLPCNLFGNPTYTPHLAEALMKLCEIPNHPRVVNIAGKEILSRYEFGLAIADVFGLDKSLITPIREVSGTAMRPLKAGLKVNFAKKLGLPIYSVYDGLKAMKDEYE